MSCGTAIRDGDKLPILIEVDNHMDKGILPEHFARTYKNDIGCFPTICTSDKPKVMSKFFGESFFTFHEEHQIVQPQVKVEREDLSPVF